MSGRCPRCGGYTDKASPEWRIDPCGCDLPNRSDPGKGASVKTAKLPWCWNSGARVNLSPKEGDNRETRCSRCGRVLKVRPAKGERGRSEATLPRHRSTANLGGV